MAQVWLLRACLLGGALVRWTLPSALYAGLYCVSALCAPLVTSPLSAYGVRASVQVWVAWAAVVVGGAMSAAQAGYLIALAAQGRWSSGAPEGTDGSVWRFFGLRPFSDGWTGAAWVLPDPLALCAGLVVVGSRGALEATLRGIERRNGRAVAMFREATELVLQTLREGRPARSLDSVVRERAKPSWLLAHVHRAVDWESGGVGSVAVVAFSVVPAALFPSLVSALPLALGLGHALRWAWQSRKVAGVGGSSAYGGGYGGAGSVGSVLLAPLSLSVPVAAWTAVWFVALVALQGAAGSAGRVADSWAPALASLGVLSIQSRLNTYWALYVASMAALPLSLLFASAAMQRSVLHERFDRFPGGRAAVYALLWWESSTGRQHHLRRVLAHHRLDLPDSLAAASAPVGTSLPGGTILPVGAIATVATATTTPTSTTSTTTAPATALVARARVAAAAVGVAVVVWATSFPSLLALVPLLPVLLLVSTYSTEWRFDRPSLPSFLLAVYASLVWLAVHVAAVWAQFARPSLFLSANDAPDAAHHYVSHGPFSDPRIRALYGTGSGTTLAGIVPPPRPVVLSLVLAAVVLIALVHWRITLAAASASSGASASDVAARRATVGERRRASTSAGSELVGGAGPAAPAGAEGVDPSRAHGDRPPRLVTILVPDARPPSSDDDDDEDDEDDGGGGNVKDGRREVGGREDGGRKDGGPREEGVPREEGGPREYGVGEKSVLSTPATEAEGKVVRRRGIWVFLDWNSTSPWSLGAMARAAGNLLLAYAFLVALVALYVLGLSHVDLVHAGYVLFFVVFSVAPGWRRRYWRLLVVYASVMIAFLFTWHLVAARANAATLGLPSWVVGVRPARTGEQEELWGSSFSTNLLVLAFAALQLPQYLREDSGAHARALRRALRPYPFVSALSAAAAHATRRYGIWLGYLALVLVPLLSTRSAMGWLTLALTITILGPHLLEGPARALRHRGPLTRLLVSMGVLGGVQGCFLFLRYAYQFPPVALWVRTLWTGGLQDLLAVPELGLVHVPSGTGLYVALLDTVVLFLAAVLGARILALRLEDVSSRLRTRQQRLHQQSSQLPSAHIDTTTTTSNTNTNTTATATPSTTTTPITRPVGTTTAAFAAQHNVSLNSFRPSSSSSSSGPAASAPAILVRPSQDSEDSEEEDEAVEQEAAEEAAPMDGLWARLRSLRRRVWESVAALLVFGGGQAMLVVAFVAGAATGEMVGVLYMTVVLLCAVLYVMTAHSLGLSRQSLLGQILSCACVHQCFAACCCGGAAGQRDVLSDDDDEDDDDDPLHPRGRVPRLQSVLGSLRDVLSLSETDNEADEQHDHYVALRGSDEVDDDVQHDDQEAGKGAGPNGGPANAAAVRGPSGGRSAGAYHRLSDSGASHSSEGSSSSSSSSEQSWDSGIGTGLVAAVEEGVVTDQSLPADVADRSASRSLSPPPAETVDGALEGEGASSGNGVAGNRVSPPSTEDVVRSAQVAAALARSLTHLPATPVAAYKAGWLPTVLEARKVRAPWQRPYRDVWAVFAVLSAALLLAVYAFQFDFFRKDGRAPPAMRASATATWFGFRQAPNVHDVTLALALWPVLWPHALVLAMAILQRSTHELEGSVRREHLRDLKSLERRGLLSSLGLDDLVPISALALSFFDLRAVRILSGHGEGGAGRGGAAGGGGGATEKSENFGSVGSIDAVSAAAGELCAHVLVPKRSRNVAARGLAARTFATLASVQEALFRGVVALRESATWPAAERARRLHALRRLDELRARLLRPKVSIWRGVQKTWSRFAPRILVDTALLALVIAALVHLDIWSVALLLLAGILVLAVQPDPPVPQGLDWRRAGGGPPSVQVAAALAATASVAHGSETWGRRAGAPLVTALLLVLIFVRALAVVGWPPFLQAPQRDWPWSADATMRYWMGVSQHATLSQLIPDFIALLCLALAVREWRMQEFYAAQLVSIVKQQESDERALAGQGAADSAAGSSAGGSAATYTAGAALAGGARGVGGAGGGSSSSGNSNSNSNATNNTITNATLSSPAGPMVVPARRWGVTEGVMEELRVVMGRSLRVEEEVVLRRAREAFAVARIAHRMHQAALARRERKEHALAAYATHVARLLDMAEAEEEMRKAGQSPDSRSPSESLVAASVGVEDVPEESAIVMESFGSMASRWDSLQLAVSRYSIPVLMIGLFLIAALQHLQNVVNAAYLAFALWFLYSPTRLADRGSSDPAFRALQVVNWLLILFQVLYQMPLVPSTPTHCTDVALCLSWQTLFGLRKYATVSEGGAVDCDPGGCVSPFDGNDGMWPAIFVLILTTLQDYIFRSAAFASSRSIAAQEVFRARIRGRVWADYEASRRAREDARFRRSMEEMRQGLLSLVQKTVTWQALLDAAAAGLSPATLRQDPRTASLWPPPPPTDVAAEPQGDGGVVVRWQPPSPPTVVADDGQQVSVAPVPSEQLSYQVEWQRTVSVLFDFTVATRTLPGATSAVIHGLVPGVGYRFRVAAFSAAGVGPHCVVPAVIHRSDWEAAGSAVLSVARAALARESAAATAPLEPPEHHADRHARMSGTTNASTNASNGAEQSRPLGQQQQRPAAEGTDEWDFEAVPHETDRVHIANDFWTDAVLFLQRFTEAIAIRLSGMVDRVVFPRSLLEHHSATGVWAEFAGLPHNHPGVPASAAAVAAVEAAVRHQRSDRRRSSERRHADPRDDRDQPHPHHRSGSSASRRRQRGLRRFRSARALADAAAAPRQAERDSSDEEGDDREAHKPLSSSSSSSSSSVPHLRMPPVPPPRPLPAPLPAKRRPVGADEHEVDSVTTRHGGASGGAGFGVVDVDATGSHEEEDVEDVDVALRDREGSGRGRRRERRGRREGGRKDGNDSEPRSRILCSWAICGVPCCPLLPRDDANDAKDGKDGDQKKQRRARTTMTSEAGREEEDGGEDGEELEPVVLGAGDLCCGSGDKLQDVPREDVPLSARRAPCSVLCLTVALSLLRVLMSQTAIVVAIAFVVNLLAYASVLSVVPVLFLFLFVLWEYPRPSSRAWDITLLYVILVIAIKFVLQTSLFCLVTDPATGLWQWEAFAGCGYVDPSAVRREAATNRDSVQPVELWGVTKYSPVYGGNGFVLAVLWDLVLLLALLAHRRVQERRGLWVHGRTVGSSFAWCFGCAYCCRATADDDQRGDDGSTPPETRASRESGSRVSSGAFTPLKRDGSAARFRARTLDESVGAVIARYRSGTFSRGFSAHSLNAGASRSSPDVSRADLDEDDPSDDADRVHVVVVPDFYASAALDDLDDDDGDLGNYHQVDERRSPPQSRRDSLGRDSDHRLRDDEQAGSGGGGGSGGGNTRSRHSDVGIATPGRRRQRVALPPTMVAATGAEVAAGGVGGADRERIHVPSGAGGSSAYSKAATESMSPFATPGSAMSESQAEGRDGPHDGDSVIDSCWSATCYPCLHWCDCCFPPWRTKEEVHAQWRQAAAAKAARLRQKRDSPSTAGDELNDDENPSSLMGHYGNVIASCPGLALHSCKHYWDSSTSMDFHARQARKKARAARNNAAVYVPLVPTKPGRDLYAWGAVMQLIILIYTVLFYSTMAGQRGSGSISQEIELNQFSGAVVVAVILEVAAIVMDRIAYLLRNLALKVCVQWSVAIVVHAICFFYFPLHTSVPFTDNAALIVFYILWVIYLFIGCFQIHLGYARTPPHDSLKSMGYSVVPSALFGIYSAIPFLMELRTILDWVASTTSMDLGMYLLLASMHNNLFTAQCAAHSRRVRRVILSGREAQGGCSKFWSGWLLFALLLLLLLLPIVIFSTLNPVLEENPVLSASVTLSVSGDDITYSLFERSQFQTILTPNNASNRDMFQSLQRNATPPGNVGSPILPAYRDQLQQVVMYSFPSEVWDASPPEMSGLLDLLDRAGNDTDRGPRVSVRFTYSFTRNLPPTGEVIGASNDVNLPVEACASLASALRIAVNLSASELPPTPTNASALDVGIAIGNQTVISDVYPIALRLPSTTLAIPIPQTNPVMRSINLQLHAGTVGDVLRSGSRNDESRSDTVLLWWTVSNVDRYGIPVEDAGVVFNLISDQVAPGIIAQSLGSYSILGVYTLIIVTLGGLLRSVFLIPVERVPYTNLDDCRDLLQLCEGIHIAQHSAAVARKAWAASSAAREARWRARGWTDEQIRDGHRRAAEIYTCHLRNEMYLYNILLRLHKSQEVLTRITRSKEP